MSCQAGVGGDFEQNQDQAEIVPATAIQDKCREKKRSTDDVVLRHEWDVQIRKQINERQVDDRAQEVTVIRDKEKAIVLGTDFDFTEL